MFHIAIECKTAVYFLMFDKCCLQVVDELLTVGLFLEHCLTPRNRDMQCGWRQNKTHLQRYTLLQ